MVVSILRFDYIDNEFFKTVTVELLTFNIDLHDVDAEAQGVKYIGVQHIFSVISVRTAVGKNYTIRIISADNRTVAERV